MEQGLYLVATPIGNLDDMTFRGIEVLKNADIIGAEDTRHSRILLERYQITTPMLSYHEHNEAKRRDEMMEHLRQGRTVALICDAGTPGISDPGADLVVAAAGENIPIHPVPGGNAVLSAVIASGLDSGRFLFEGFLPRINKKRKERLQALATNEVTAVIYISPHRLKEDLKDLLCRCGDRPATLCRELTKIHESFHRGTLASLLDLAESRELKGEMVLVLGAAEKHDDTPSPEKLRKEVKNLLDQGMKSKDAAQIIAERYHMKKNQIYPYTIADEEGE